MGEDDVITELAGWLTADEAVRRLNVTRTRLQQLVNDGTIRTKRIDQRTALYSEVDVAIYISRPQRNRP